MPSYSPGAAFPQNYPTEQGEYTEHFVRPRMNQLLARAIRKNLAIISAGMGYGKTLAVSDFVRENDIPVIWMQFSDFDNISQGFWENYTRAVEQISKSFAQECRNLGFPDTGDKMNQYLLQRDRIMANQRYLTVFDDIHLVKDPSVIGFIEHIVYNTPVNRTLILICRELPKINLSGLMLRGLIANIDEDDLRFTENEMSQYLLMQGLSSELHDLPEILKDTQGWAFVLNFLVRILKKSLGYTDYVRNFMKQSIFQLMEMEAWTVISAQLQHFLTRLSLVNRLSADLVLLLAEGNEGLLEELNRQRVVYIRFDDYTGCYLIHHLFLDYLQSKQGILSREEIRSTYKISAQWCMRNGFVIDALNYYEKIGDYPSIVRIIHESPTQLLIGSAQHIKGIFDRTPEGTHSRVLDFAGVHLRILILADQWQEALTLLGEYERQALLQTEGNEHRDHTLSAVYYYWGVLRQMMCTSDDAYDFDVYYEKMSRYPAALPAQQIRECYPLGPWISRAGNPRQGAPLEYLGALSRSAKAWKAEEHGRADALVNLCRGEMLFYQGEIDSAKASISGVWEQAEKNKYNALTHFAALYTIRIAAWQGNYEKMEQALKSLEAVLEENDYDNRFTYYDHALGLYYYILRKPEKTPAWLKNSFAPYSHTNFLENAGNLIKARYFYLTKQFTPLLTYMEEQKHRELTVYGLVERLAMEACVHYQMKNKAKAFLILREACEAACPNAILTPFAEMGKDMRTLSIAALQDPDCAIPQAWLKKINQRSAGYARRQTLLISAYRKANHSNTIMELTHRETEVLRDLNQGLSRPDIAANQSLSINTVRLIVNTIYEKLEARNIADLIRIAHEQDLL